MSTAEQDSHKVFLLCVCVLLAQCGGDIRVPDIVRCIHIVEMTNEELTKRKLLMPIKTSLEMAQSLANELVSDPKPNDYKIILAICHRHIIEAIKAGNSANEITDLDNPSWSSS